MLQTCAQHNAKNRFEVFSCGNDRCEHLISALPCLHDMATQESVLAATFCPSRKCGRAIRKALGSHITFWGTSQMSQPRFTTWKTWEMMNTKIFLRLCMEIHRFLCNAIGQSIDFMISKTSHPRVGNLRCTPQNYA